jgi:hypothetical protein
MSHMKNLLTIGAGLVLAAAVSGCASPTAGTPSQAAQVGYAQACAAYAAMFATALELRKAGKLNPAQINQVTLIDSQVTPVCTGPLPADPDAATVQITAAVTALTILEVAQKGN